MAANELAVVARLKDQVSPGLRTLAQSLTRFARVAVTPFTALYKAVTSLRTAMLGLGAYLGAKLASEFVNATAESHSALLALSQQANVTAASLSAMQYAAGQTGVGVDTLRDAVLTLRNKMGDALRGSKAQADAFAKLGISVRDLADGQVDLVDLFGRVSDGLRNVGTASERSRLLVDLFGESAATRLMPMLSEGAIGLRELSAEAERFGRVFDESSLKAGRSFVRARNQLSEALRGLRDQFFTAIYPALTKIIEQLAQFIADNRKAILEGMRDFAVQFLEIVRGLMSAVGWIADLGSGRGRQETAITVWTGQLEQMQDESRQAANEIARLRAGIAAGPGSDFTRVGGGDARDFEAAQKQLESLERYSEDLDWRIMQMVAKIGDAQANLPAPGAASATGAIEGLQDRLRGMSFSGSSATGDGQAYGPENRVPDDQLWEAPGRVTENWKSVTDGIKQGRDAFIESIGTLQTQVAQSTQQMATGFVDVISNGFGGLIDGSMNAKEAFRQMGLDMLKMIAQLLVKFALLRLVSNFLGGGGGATPAIGGVGAAPSMSAAGGVGVAGFGGGVGGGRGVTGGAQVNINITTPDASGVRTLLYQERNTLAGIIAQAMRENRSFRLAMQG